MTLNKQEASEWVSRLAEALDDLAGSVTAGRINLPTLTNSQYRDLADHADRIDSARLLFEEYIPKLGSDPSAAIGILQDHPVIRRESAGSTGKPAIMAISPPGSATRLELDWLATWLTKTAVSKGGRYAAETLEHFLNLSEAKALPGHQITVFRGLEVERRFEIGKGAFIAPYEDLVDRGLLREREEVPWETPPGLPENGSCCGCEESHVGTWHQAPDDQQDSV